jgi:hypothetical protein
MKAIILTFTTCSIIGLSGCATSYKSNGFTGGYTNTQLTPDVFRVSFRGNAYTSPERAQDFALLRASELTLQHGFICFAIIDEQNSTTTQTYTTPSQSETTAYGTGESYGNVYLNPYGGTYEGNSSLSVHSTTTYSSGQTYVFYKPRTGLLIRCFQKKPDGIFTFDAVFLQQSLKQTYQIK